jgi:hypothetical protein
MVRLEYDDCLQLVEAVYTALANSTHAEYAIRAARRRVYSRPDKASTMRIRSSSPSPPLG